MTKFQIYIEADKENLKRMDSLNHVLGLYVRSAILSAFDNKSKYPEEPILSKEEAEYIDASNYSEEEKQRLREQLFGKLQDMMDEHERAEKLKGHKV